MKSVGETMAIGMTFKESFPKGLAFIESDRFGGGRLGGDELPRKEVIKGNRSSHRETFLSSLRQSRLFCGGDIRTNQDRSLVYRQLEQISEFEDELKSQNLDTVDTDSLRLAKEYGFSTANWVGY